jgi:pyroglutamyl-peptidase
MPHGAGKGNGICGGVPVLLVTGFGPFLEVTDNPSAALARGVDGAVIPSLSSALLRTTGAPRGLRGAAGGPVRVVGQVLPVSFARAPDLVVQAARALDAVAVLGFGVAVTRPLPCVERVARVSCVPRPDVDGVVLERLAPLGALEAVPTTIDAAALADALGAELSDDAGGYVCNAWLYRVAQALPDRGVGFVHVPVTGLDPARLLAALTGTTEA